MKAFNLLGMVAVVLTLTACGGADSTDPGSGPELITQELPTVPSGKARLLAGSLTGECGAIARNGAMAFHQGELWIAERGCDGSSRVQVVNADTGAVRTHIQVMSNPNAARATGFMNPTGMTFDDQGTLYVADAAGEHGRWSYEGMTPTSKPQVPGHSAGVWKITPQTMEIFAGIMRTGLEDGSRETASFTSPNGLVMAWNGVLYTNDNSKIRSIYANGDVLSDNLGDLGSPFLPLCVNHSQIPHVSRYSINWGLSLWELFDPNWPFAELPEGTGKVVVFANEQLFTSGLAPAPDQPMPFSIYRDSKIVVENVQYLNTFVADEAGNLYIQQRNAIVKVVFN